MNVEKTLQALKISMDNTFRQILTSFSITVQNNPHRKYTCHYYSIFFVENLLPDDAIVISK